MITKNDFKSKQFSETRKILDTEIEKGLKRELEYYYPSEERIDVVLLNTEHVPINDDVKEYIKDRLINVHGFDWDDLYSIYKPEDNTGNIIVGIYVV